MSLRNKREVDIANLLDKGYTYSYIEAMLNVFPAQIARVKHKMRMIRAESPITSESWDLLTEVEIAMIEEEARLLLTKLKANELKEIFRKP